MIFVSVVSLFGILHVFYHRACFIFVITFLMFVFTISVFVIIISVFVIFISVFVITVFIMSHMYMNICNGFFAMIKKYIRENSSNGERWHSLGLAILKQILSTFVR